MNIDLSYSCAWSSYDLKEKVPLMYEVATFVTRDGEYLWLTSEQIENEIWHLNRSVANSVGVLRREMVNLARKCDRLIEFDIIASVIMPLERDFTIIKLEDHRGWELKIPIDMIASQRCKNSCDMIAEEVISIRNGTVLSRYSHDMVLQLFSYIDEVQSKIPELKNFLEDVRFIIQKTVNERERLIKEEIIRPKTNPYCTLFMSSMPMLELEV